MRGNPVSKHHIQPLVWGMSSRLTRDGTTESVSRDHLLWRERGQDKCHFILFSLLQIDDVHEQNWQRHPVGPYSAESVDHTYMHIGRNMLPVSHISPNEQRGGWGGGGYAARFFSFVLFCRFSRSRAGLATRVK